MNSSVIHAGVSILLLIFVVLVIFFSLKQIFEVFILKESYSKKKERVEFILKEFDFLNERKKDLGEGYPSEQIDELLELGSENPKLFEEWRKYSREIESKFSNDAILLPSKMLVGKHYQGLLYMDDCYSLEEFEQKLKE